MDSLDYAKDAGYEPEKGCLRGTREEILQAIMQWIENPNGPVCYWLCGMAGTGKSSILQSIAQYCDERGILGSSFFFDSAHLASRRPNNLFSTIARDIASRDAAVIEALLINIRKDTPEPRHQRADNLINLCANPYVSPMPSIRS